MTKAANIIYDKLDAVFEDAKCELDFSNNFELLVAVMLSAQCTDKRVNIVTKELFKQYPDAKALANADIKQLERAIYSCGFYHNKAKNLIAMANDLVNNYQGQVPGDFGKLVDLAGVGRKTANVVLAVGFNEQTIAVDTHVFRVSNRLGIVKADNPYKCEMALQKVIDKEKWAKFHHMLVLFGRYYCKSQSPKCQDCVLQKHCKYYKGK